MGTQQHTDGSARQGGSGMDPVGAVRDSVLLKLAVAGVALIAIAGALQLFVVNPTDPGLVGIWTGMLPIWGIALILVSLGSYLYVWIRRR